MATVTVQCHRCHSEHVCRDGRSTSPFERFRCRSGKRVFQLTYTGKERMPEVYEHLFAKDHNGSGVRDAARTLKSGINTVIQALKALRPPDNLYSSRSRRRRPHL